jgi:hypothetical protein
MPTRPWKLDGYSYLKASMGSRRDALMAGKRPQKIPMLVCSRIAVIRTCGTCKAATTRGVEAATRWNGNDSNVGGRERRHVV